MIRQFFYIFLVIHHDSANYCPLAPSIFFKDLVDYSAHSRPSTGSWNINFITGNLRTAWIKHKWYSPEKEKEVEGKPVIPATGTHRAGI